MKNLTSAMFNLQYADAKKLVKRLEADASFDKVGSIYYELKKWIDDEAKRLSFASLVKRN